MSQIKTENDVDASESVPRHGVARIKKEYQILVKGNAINWDFVEDGKETTHTQQDHNDEAEPGQKRPRIDDRDLHPDKKYKLKGQHKNKLRYNMGKRASWARNGDKDQANEGGRNQRDKSKRLCLRLMDSDGYCHFGDKCEYSHDAHKIYKLNESTYFCQDEKPCYIYSTYGRCQFGVACLFCKSHTKVLDEQNKVFNLIDHKKWSVGRARDEFLYKYHNKLDSSLQHKLRKKEFDFKLVTNCMNALYRADHENNNHSKTQDEDDDEKEDTQEQHVQKCIGAAIVDEHFKGRDFERKKVEFKEKLILAPLTTVGNLPFRRLCKKFSCDITCAEMSLATPLLTGNPSEWSHVKRHECEDVFGIQLTTTHPEMMTKAVKVISDECEVDYIDFNCGCPTEWIYQSGAGAGLMGRPSKLRKMIAGAAMVSKVPITIKLRSGVSDDKNTAHNLINSVVRPFTSKYVGAVTVHGRSRAQRYTKLADWDYINECGKYTDDIPLIGSGDCISWQDYYGNLETYSRVSAVMIGRGALLAPWLFTEIRERRTWDISSRERLDIIGDYAKFALDHWGSDSTGVENSRRYLLEWLSFACRYIPVGLLEVLPQKINERPPKYRGRDELETLLSSPAASDWVKISEMFLGKVPENFKFLPKHKSNAYESIVEG